MSDEQISAVILLQSAWEIILHVSNPAWPRDAEEETQWRDAATRWLQAFDAAKFGQEPA